MMNHNEMHFFSLVNKLKEEHAKNTLRRANKTLLLNPGKIPRAQHILYEPLTPECIDEYLIQAYKNTVPDQYIQFLRYSNGIELFMFKILYGKFSFAGSNLTIYGIPRTKPFPSLLKLNSENVFVFFSFIVSTTALKKMKASFLFSSVIFYISIKS